RTRTASGGGCCFLRQGSFMFGLDYGLWNAELRGHQWRLCESISDRNQAGDHTVDKEALPWISTKGASWAKLAMAERHPGHLHRLNLPITCLPNGPSLKSKQQLRITSACCALN